MGSTHWGLYWAETKGKGSKRSKHITSNGWDDDRDIVNEYDGVLDDFDGHDDDEDEDELEL